MRKPTVVRTAQDIIAEATTDGAQSSDGIRKIIEDMVADDMSHADASVTANDLIEWYGQKRAAHAIGLILAQALVSRGARLSDQALDALKSEAVNDMDMALSTRANLNLPFNMHGEFVRALISIDPSVKAAVTSEAIHYFTIHPDLDALVSLGLTQADALARVEKRVAAYMAASEPYPWQMHTHRMSQAEKEPIRANLERNLWENAFSHVTQWDIPANVARRNIPQELLARVRTGYEARPVWVDVALEATNRSRSQVRSGR